MKRPGLRVLALALRNIAQEPRRLAPGIIQVGMVLTCVLVGIAMQAQLSRDTAPGMKLIHIYFTVNVIALHLLALVRMAPAIAEEREEQTLGLLRMTGIGPWGLLLGKGLVPAWSFLQLLALQIPLGLLAVTLGGVDLHAVGMALVVLCGHFCWVWGLSLFAGSVTRTRRQAGILLLTALAVYPYGHILMEILTEMFRDLRPMRTFSRELWDLGPFERLQDVLGGRGGFPLDGARNEALLGLGWLLLARLCLPFHMEDGMAEGSARGLLRRRKAGDVRKRSFTPGRPGAYALFWKDLWYHGGGRFWVGLRVALLYLVVLPSFLLNLGVSFSKSRPWDRIFLWLFWLGLLWIWETARGLSKVFRLELNQRTLSSLFLLPGSFARVLRQKFLGSLAPCLVHLPLLALVFAYAVAMTPARHLDDFIPPLLFIAFTVIGLFHLIAALSLVLPHGAIPLAFGVVVLGDFLLILTGETVDHYFDADILFPLLAGLLWVPLSIGLFVWMRRELPRLAAEN